MATQLCIFEDELVTNFLPLVHFRPIYDLRCGMYSLREKIQHRYPAAPIVLQCRSEIAALVREKNPQNAVNELSSSTCLFINGRVLAGDSLAKLIPLRSKSDSVYMRGDDVAAAFVSGAHLERIKYHLSSPVQRQLFKGIPVVDVEVAMVSYPWDLIHENAAQIEPDLNFTMRKLIKKQSHIQGKIYPGVHLLNKKAIFIGKGSIIKPGAVIDAETGPVYIGRNVTVMPHVTIIGPACIWDDSVVKVGGQIYGGTTIGPMCKVGGEVEGSILQGYSNKQHAGFLGHSYLGSWVNLGADTNNSDLKNNYSSVKVQHGSKQIDTGLTFLGLIMGDHTKSGINTMFNTGTIVGTSCNVYGSDFPPKYIPSFSWGSVRGGFVTYAFEKALDVARKVMARRNVTLPASEEKIFSELFDSTRDDRRQSGVKD